jgi:hypothetical protein
MNTYLLIRNQARIIINKKVRDKILPKSHFQLEAKLLNCLNTYSIVFLLSGFRLSTSLLQITMMTVKMKL